MRRKKTSNNYSRIILIVAVLTLILLYKNRKVVKEAFFTNFAVLVAGAELGAPAPLQCDNPAHILEYDMNFCRLSELERPCCRAPLSERTHDAPQSCTHAQRNEPRCTLSQQARQITRAMARGILRIFGRTSSTPTTAMRPTAATQPPTAPSTAPPTAPSTSAPIKWSRMVRRIRRERREAKRAARRAART